MSIPSMLKKFLIKTKRPGTITIVSGLPRSGTSLMMQMLEAGGMEMLTDSIRKADKNNPRGYYEFEKVKDLDKDNSWLNLSQDKVVKVVSLLLFHLPDNKNYKMIFMKRNQSEILASQQAMLDHLQIKEAGGQDEKLAEEYRNHLQKLEKWLGQQNPIDVLYISYNDIIQNPGKNANKVKHFLARDLNVEAMTRVVDSSLYRQRK
jgi:hypothetical protein